MPEDPLCTVIAKSFRTVLASRRISKTQAAKELRVSRQMFHQYLKAKSLPKRDVLQRACDAWGLRINYRGLIVDRESFPAGAPESGGSSPSQLKLDLQEAIARLENQDLGIRILRKGNGRVELQIDLSFGSVG
jgi:transcriptional regulator with XRE-family HTH domain